MSFVGGELYIRLIDSPDDNDEETDYGLSKEFSNKWNMLYGFLSLWWKMRNYLP